MTQHTNGNSPIKQTPVKQATQEDLKKLDSLIKDIKAAMLTTMEDDGTHRSRPMWTIGREFDGKIYFFTDIHSAKAYEVRKFPSINLTYADSGAQNYVSITGTCKVITDRGKIAELYKPMHKVWFPDGPYDPNLCALEITADYAEYWDSPGGMIPVAIGMIKALVTGKPHQHEESENEKLNFSKN
ncbi:MAG TPA: pyridoxamine 5'-phosphate oxidase family protein [Candidatus Kapabacteria bacterium]|nr:pyridoxamine 5'-phosphate oxidase family protein [Candidatus Kapabacteria bacterium]